MYYSSLPKQTNHLQQLYKSQLEQERLQQLLAIGSLALQKAEDLGLLGDDPENFEKGRPAMPIGAKATWAGVDYMKTASGWKPVGKKRGHVKENHDFIHNNEEKDKDHHAMVMDAGKMGAEEWSKKHGTNLHEKYKAVHDYLHKPKAEKKVESSTPINDAFRERQKGIDKDKVYEGSEGLAVGDYIRTDTGTMGFVKKVNPKNITVETLYGGYGGNDSELMELKIEKNKVKQHLKPKGTQQKNEEDPEAKYKVKLSNGETDLRKETSKLTGLSKEDHEKLAEAHNTLTAHKHTEFAGAKMHHAEQRDAHREAAKNSTIPEKVKEKFADVSKDTNFSFLNSDGRIWRRDNSTGEIKDHKEAPKSFTLPK